MKKLTILTFIAASIAFSSCHSNDKNNNRQNDTSAAKRNEGPADSVKSSASGSDTTGNSPDTTSLGADTDSAVHPVH